MMDVLSESPSLSCLSFVERDPGTMPGISNVIGLIKSRRRRDHIILGVTIGVCVVIILTYVWS